MRVNFSSGRKLGGTFLADLAIQAPEYALCVTFFGEGRECNTG